MPKSRRYAFYALVVALSTAACNKSSGSTTPTSPNTTPTPTPTPTVVKSYAAVVALPARPGKAAAISLSAAVPGLRTSALRPAATVGATGTIVTQNGGSGTLSGTFDTSSNQFVVNGLGYFITANVSGDALKGAGSQVSEPGLPVAAIGTFTPTVTTTSSHLPSGASTQTWVGTARSNVGQNCGNPVQSVSQFQFVLQATSPIGANGAGTASVTGHFVNDTDHNQGTFKGTAQYDGAGGGTLTLTVDPPNDSAKGAGTFNGTSWSGTYQGGSPAGCEVGTWAATKLN